MGKYEIDRGEKSLSADCPTYAAFERLWQREAADLWRFCLRRVGGDPVDADEALSCVAMRGLRHHDLKIANGRAWLRKIASNICIDLQRERRQRNRCEPIDGDDAAPFVEIGATHLRTPEALYFEREQKQRLWRAIEHLPPSLSRLIKLHYADGMLLGDIALLTGMSESNVRRKIGEACHRMRSFLRTPRGCVVEPADTDDDERFGIEMPRRFAAIRFVQVTTAAGVERDVYLWLAEMPRRNSKQTNAKLEEYIARHPGGWRKRLLFARVLRNRGDLRQATGHYEAVLERRPSHVAAWIELAESVEVLEGAAAAAAVLEDGARRVRPDVAPLLEALAWAAAGRTEAAVERLLTLLTGTDRDGYVWAHVGRICAGTGMVERAVDAFERALSQDPRSGVLLAMSLDVLRRAGQDREARERLAAALAADASNAVALQREVLRRAAQRAAEDEQEIPETALLVRRLSAVAGNAVDTIYALAELAQARGASRRALALAESLLERHPANAAAWLRYAQLCQAWGVAGSVTVADALRHADALDPVGPQARNPGLAALATLLPAKLRSVPPETSRESNRGKERARKRCKKS